MISKARWGGLACAALAACLWWLAQHQGVNSGESSAHSAVEEAARRARPKGPWTPQAERWRLGQQRRWRLRFEQQIAVLFEGKPTHTSRLDLSGVWTVTPTDRDEDLIRLLVVLDAPDLSLDGATRGDEIEALRGALLKPAFVSVRPDGRLADLHVERGASIAAEDLTRAVARAFLHTEPVGNHAEAWTVEERDATGTYRASYGLSAPESDMHPASVRALKRTKSGYQRLLDEDTRADSIEVAHQTLFALDAARWPVSVSLDEAQAWRGGALDLDAELKARFIHEDERQAAELIGAFSRDAPRFESTGPQGALRAELRAANALRDWDKRRLGDQDFMQLLGLLGALGDSTDDVRESHDLQGQVGALMRLQPETARAVGEAAGVAQSARVRQNLLGALAQVDTPQAHRALRDLMERGIEQRDDALLLGTLASLTMSNWASREAAARLLELARSRPGDQVGGGAALAAGAQGRSLQDSDPDAAEAIAIEIAAMHAATREDNRRATLISAMGNSGDPSAEPVIREAVKASSWRVRQAAVFALRYYPGAENDALLREALLEDPSPFVRVEVIQTVPFREAHQFLGPLVLSVARDPHKGVRGAVLSLAEGRSSWASLLTPGLQICAAEDPEAGLRARAHALLVGGP